MNRVAYTILAHAVIWGLVIVGCSLQLKGTGMYQEIQNVLYGGASASLIIGNMGLWLGIKKEKEKTKETE